MIISSNPSPSSKPTMELLTHSSERHEIGDGGWLMMTTATISPLRSPKRTPDLPSRGRTGGGGGSVSWNAIILSPSIFSGKIGFYSVGLRVCGATRWGQPTWVNQERGACPGGLCPHRCPSPVGLGSRNSYLLVKIPRKVYFHSENFYFCTKTTPW